jgi:chaperone required for assembly of F1-ATPase
MADETEAQRWQRLSQERIDRSLPERFYKIVTIGEDHSILLDGRAVRTPKKKKLTLPTAALAEAVAGEWRAQVKVINPALMPLTKLANTAIDRMGAERLHVAGEVVAFAANDLVCYRAGEPAELVSLQARHWNPVLHWAQAALDAAFKSTVGVIHVPQPPPALQAVEQHIGGFDDFTLSAVHNATTLTGSALLALMLQACAISPEDAWTAAHVDDDFQIGRWGEDFEAAARRSYRQTEFEATCRFLNLFIRNVSE